MKKDLYPTEVLEVTVEKLDHTGVGFVRYIHPPEKGPHGKHLLLFIDNVVPGDKVRVTVPNAKGRHKASLSFDELLEPSPMRNLDMPVDREMAAGAPLQFMKYEDQLAHKENLIKGYLAEAGFDTNLVKPIMGMDNPYRYRNKMELTFGVDGSLGMHQQGNYRKVIDLEDSILAPEEMIAIKKVVSKWQKDYQFPGLDKDTKEGLLCNLLMRQSFATGEIMVAIYALEAPDAYTEAIEDLTQRLLNAQPRIVSFQWLKKNGGTERSYDNDVYLIHGRDYINDELQGFKFRIWADTFFQVNPVQANKMVETAIDMAQVKEDMKVLDLFCGIGTFSLQLAAASKSLAGIEIVENSINSAKRNAADNNLDNTFFMASDARAGLRVLPDVWGQPDLLLLDPPRNGAGGKVMRAIGRFGTDRIVYVSCGPKSLAADLVWLLDFGYEVVEVQPIDQFPHTAHLENIVLLKKKELKD